jgi:hypothetical protein
VSNLVPLLKIIAVLAATIMIGNWFLGEIKKAQLKGKPWYAPYLSIPGLLIIFALMLPIIIWVIKNG